MCVCFRIYYCMYVLFSFFRAAYTKRILEIIGNIRKQNDEIQKILKDTRQIQKEINILSGQVDRSFTDSDELIFQVQIYIQIGELILICHPRNISSEM